MTKKPDTKPHLEHMLAKLRKSSFVRNILVVMSGTVAAQVIGFALTPIMSRLFSPSDFGVFGSFIAIYGVIAAGMTLDYSQAIMLPYEKKDGINLLMFSFLSTVLITICCLAAYLLAPTIFQSLMKAPNTWIPALLIVAIFFSGLNETCQAWCVRIKAFKDTSASQVIRSVSSNGTQIGFGYLGAGAAGLIISSVLADFLASFNLARVLLPDFLASWRDIRWDRMKQLAKEYRDFPMYSASMSVINALSQGLPVLLLIQFYGIAVAGAYAFGLRILKTPMNLVLTSLRQVLFQKASEVQHQGGSLASLYVKITAGLFALAFFPSLILFIWAPQIFSWIFGAQWHTAGEFARILVLWMMFMFCNVPAVYFSRLIRIQHAVFFYDLMLLAARALVLVLGGMYLSASHTIILFSLVGAVMNVFLILLVGRAVMKKEGRANFENIRNCLMEG